MTPPPTLMLQATRTVIAGADGEFIVDVGVDNIAALFRRAVPSGADIEAAIDVVEDAIGRAGKSPALASIACGEPDVLLAAEAAGLVIAPGAVFAADAVERLFTRLAAASSGALPAADALPPGPRFAATLLILRELMHHLQVRELRLLP